MEYEKSRETSDYSVSDARFWMGRLDHPRLRGVTLVRFNRMLWVDMVYAKATERRHCRFHMQPSRPYFPMYYFSLFRTKKMLAIIMIYYQLATSTLGEFLCGRGRQNGNATVGREWETWRVIPTVIGTCFRRFAIVAKRTEISAWLDMISVWIIYQ